MESVFLLWWTVCGITVDLYALSNHLLYGSCPWNSLFYASKATKKTRNNYFDSENKFEIAILTVNEKNISYFQCKNWRFFFFCMHKYIPCHTDQKHIHIFIELFVINNYITTYIVFYQTKSCQTYTNPIC
jgi:hypothetical protein